MPLGGPVDFPPCIRHLPFVMAGDWQDLPFLVFAPHRRESKNAGFAWGLFAFSISYPSPLAYIAYDRLAALTDIDMLHGNSLLTFVPMSIQGFKLLGVKAHELDALALQAKIHVDVRGVNLCLPEAIHCVVIGYQHHAYKLAFIAILGVELTHCR